MPQPEARAAAALPKIRPFRADDIDAAIQIVHQSPGAAPWSRGGHERLIESPTVLGFTAEFDSLIVGFLITRLVVEDAEILNIAVVPGRRRAGVGSALLLASLEQLSLRHAARVFLEVRESNVPAIAFYTKFGFVPAGRRKSYYSNPVEDAISMEKKLTT